MFLKVVWILFNLIVSVGICSIPIIAFGWIDRDKELVSRISRFWANWMIWSTGIQYDIFGLENIQNSKQYVFMCNHESALDIILGVATIPNKIVFLAKKELFRIPIFGLAMKALGMIKIDRQNPEIAIKSVDYAVDRLIRSSFSTLIYPEGTRSENGKLLPFKKGGFVLAIRSQLPVVPITILGAGEALSKGKYNINNKKISVIISEPIITKGMGRNDKDLLLQNCRNVIENNLKYLKQNHKAEFELYSVR